MTKKILICEDDASVARAMYRNLEDLGYTPSILVDKNPKKIPSRVEEAINKSNPDYLIVDGLEGYCFDVMDLVKKINPDISTIIFSGDSGLKIRAREYGYDFICKGNRHDLYDFLADKDLEKKEKI